jgi:DNA-directed RNA polymerase specialized sigma24 family protein
MTKNEFNLQLNNHAGSLQSFALNFTKDVEDANDLVQDITVNLKKVQILKVGYLP